ncbi:autophagy-related protein 16 [Amylocarpus encephaloides]|uniref:Autophagy-related protein 16 n=1 Tax=Amylocarpus encephaloides TaxID=45428 RepID=A0A9P7YN18_9HELO|nr:autophagy-related protein 16 [Amylocarpus encephaloides]
MSSWQDEYTQALRDRDSREKASYSIITDDLINAFTDLLARTAALESEKAALDSSTAPSPSSRNSPKPSSPSPSPSPSPAPAPSNAVAEASPQLKADLASALRSNNTLQTRVKMAEAEVQKLRAKNKADTKTLETLSRGRSGLAQKVKDRDEELRGKAKLLDDVQDEVISLNIQLNMSEKDVKKLRGENKELIDRWMTYKGREAEAMNDTLK